MDSPTGACREPADTLRRYLAPDYRQHYAALLRQHPAPAEAIAELCLFRFWLASRAHGHSGAGPASAPPLCLPAGWTLPRQAAGIDIEDALGARIGHLLESRFDLYDRFFQLGRHADDPLGLDAAALALSCQLFVQPSPGMRAWLCAETRAMFARLAAAFRHA